MTDEKKDNPLAVAESLRTHLKTVDIEENRQKLITEIKEVFVASRMETSSLQEQLRAAAIVNLLEKVQSNQMSTAQLMRVIEMTNLGGEKDLNSIVGGGKGPMISINNNPQTANIGTNPMPPLPAPDTKGNPVQNTGFLLEAVSNIVRQLNKPEFREDAKNIIEGVHVEIKKDEE